MNRYFIFLILVIFPLIAYPQFAGEEINFDVKTENKKHKIKANTSPKKEDNVKRETQHRKNYVTIKPQQTTYLEVNKQTFLYKKIDARWAYETYAVNTNVKSWDVYDMPSWCHVTKKSKNSFSLYYDDNPTHFERKGWFIVKADDKSVRVEITQLGQPVHVTAKINAIALEQNIQTTIYNSLFANINVSIKGAKELGCVCILYITDENGNAIKANNSNYSLNGVAGLTAKITPLTDNESIYNIRMEIPHYILTPINKKKVFKLNVGIAYNNKRVSNIETIEFITKKNRRKVKNGILKTELTKRQESINLTSSRNKNVYKPYTIMANPMYK